MGQPENAPVQCSAGPEETERFKLHCHISNVLRCVVYICDTHSQVVVDELRPAEEVGQAVKRSEFTAQELLSFLISDGV